ncbi:MAG: YqaA family protein [Anaerolineae bacterium]
MSHETIITESKEKPWLEKATKGYWRLLALPLAGVISLAIILLRDRFMKLAAYGYPSVFLVSLLGNATIVLPAPSLALVFAMSSVLSPVGVGLVAGLGEALGELTGFAAGYGGRTIIEDRALYQRLTFFMKRYGLVAIFLLSVFPNPFFDLAGIAAGALRFPLWQFLLACWLGKTVKTTLIALAGAYSIPLVEQLWLS